MKKAIWRLYSGYRDNRYSGGERIGAKGKKKLKILSRVVRPPSVALRASGPHPPDTLAIPLLWNYSYIFFWYHHIIEQSLMPLAHIECRCCELTICVAIGMATGLASSHLIQADER